MPAWQPNQSAQEQIRAEFSAGEKPPQNWLVGIERERLMLKRDDCAALPFEGEVSVSTILNSLKERFDWQPVYLDGHLLGLNRRNANVTLEPAGQLELSGSPYRSIAEIHNEVGDLEAELQKLCIERSIVHVYGGLNPLHTPEELVWIPKSRYAVMRQVLPTRGSMGLSMMGLSSSMQVSVDYSSEQDCQKKFRAVCGLAPIITAMYANSPIYNRQKTGFISYRTYIWQNTDPSRCGIPAFVFQDGDFYDLYRDYALQVPMLFKRTLVNGKEAYSRDDRSFAEVAEQEGEWDQDAWTLHLSTIFTEARLKQLIEVRIADSNRLDLALSMPALCKALLYHAGALDEVSKLTQQIDCADRQHCQLEAARLGLSKSTFGRHQMLEVAQEVFHIAQHALKDLDKEQGTDDVVYLDSLGEQVLSKKMSPGEEILQLWDGRWRQSPQELITYLSKTNSPGSLPKAFSNTK